MKTILKYLVCMIIISSCTGCAPLIIGSAVGVVGGYAVSKDTIEGDTDKPYDQVWSAALEVLKIRGTVKKEDYTHGTIEGFAQSSRVWVKFSRLTQATTRIQVSSRKHRLPNLSLAQDIFVKIMEQAGEAPR